MIDEHLKERVRESSDIVDVMGADMTLRNQGRGFVALCPWHDDRKPSLTINREHQSFRCWVCDVGGDVFAYVMRRDNCTFPAALQFLAERAGIKLDPNVQSGPSKQRLLELMEWAAKEFSDCLAKHPEAGPVRAYVRGRKVSPGAAKEFRMGWSPNEWHWLTNRATANGFSFKELDATGLTVTGDRGQWDRFRDRLLFPIADPNGVIVGFGGRALPPNDKEGAKYVNTPETTLFSKQRLLYGLHLAASSIREHKVAAIMEGYTDVVACKQAAVSNVTAVMGTALTEHHCRLITRYAQKAALIFDGDAAGTKRTKDCLPALMATGLDICVVEIPGKKDPAEFIEAEGGQKFFELIEKAPDAVDYLAGKVREDQANGDKSSKTLQDVLNVFAGCRGDEVQLKIDQAIARISRQTGISSEAMRRFMERSKKPKGKDKGKAEQPETAVAPPVVKPIPRTDLELFWAAFASEDVAGQVVESVPDEVLGSEISCGLLEILRTLDLDGKPLTAQIAMETAETLELKNLISAATHATIDVSPRECFQSLQQRWNLRQKTTHHRQSRAKIETSESEEEQIQALQALVEMRVSESFGVG